MWNLDRYSFGSCQYFDPGSLRHSGGARGCLSRFGVALEGNFNPQHQVPRLVGFKEGGSFVGSAVVIGRSMRTPKIAGVAHNSWVLTGSPCNHHQREQMFFAWVCGSRLGSFLPMG